MIDRFSIEQSKYADGFKYVIGVDEVGRGPLAGPVVASAVCFESKLFYPWWDEIFDSKKVSAKKREELAHSISEFSLNSIGVASVEEIEELNILEASFLAMKRAVEKLSIDLSSAIILVDGKFTIPEFTAEQKAFIKGDSSVHSIAAASIVAKVSRDKLMVNFDQQIPGYGFMKHKGYGTPDHIKAIKKLGLSSIHRPSFCGNIV